MVHQYKLNILTRLALYQKIRKSKHIILEALRRYPFKQSAIAWTGGKDSTLLLWLVRTTCVEYNINLPYIIIINEGSPFKEAENFQKKLSRLWHLRPYRIQNKNVLRHVKAIGSLVEVKKLSRQNKTELARIDFKGFSFPFHAESFVGNHLMKTVPLNNFIVTKKVSALFTGIRWDEHEARGSETYVSPRRHPPHNRIHPILHFSERDVWNATMEFSVPFAELYRRGYRSLGAKYSTKKSANQPAWLQDFRNIRERQGRLQDKEHTMEKLRNLGYM